MTERPGGRAAPTETRLPGGAEVVDLARHITWLADVLAGRLRAVAGAIR